MYDFLSNNTDSTKHAMVGYRLCNTLSENGHVARGVCTVENGSLVDVTERTQIIKKGESAFYTEDEQTWTELDYNSTVSMNMWGFMPSIFNKIEEGFVDFLTNQVKNNPLKAEYYIPSVVSEVINSGEGTVTVMQSKDKWYGVTYQADKEVVRDAISNFINEGVYPKNLWELK